MARTQRCAGEGELVFGFTKHGETLPKHGLTCKEGYFGGLGRVVRGRRSVRGGVAAADGHERGRARQSLPMARLAGPSSIMT